LVINDLQDKPHPSVHKLANKETVNESDLEDNNITHSLNIISAEPIKIKDKESAIQRLKQWALQRDQIEKIGVAFNVYKFYHRMALVDIYNEINVVAAINFPNQKDKQRVFEREIICAQEGISERSERRFKTSATRLRRLVDSGISFNQLVKTGMHVTDFEASKNLYEKFIETLDIDSIENLNEVDTKGLLDKLSTYKIIELD